jgi:hypothetical protein
LKVAYTTFRPSKKSTKNIFNDFNIDQGNNFGMANFGKNIWTNFGKAFRVGFNPTGLEVRVMIGLALATPCPDVHGKPHVSIPNLRPSEVSPLIFRKKCYFFVPSPC